MFLARMDEGSAGFTMASIDLSEAVNKVAAPFKSVAVSGGKRLSTSIATGVRTHADAAAVAQVVELLLDNAPLWRLSIRDAASRRRIWKT